MEHDIFNAKGTLKTSLSEYTIYRLDSLEKQGLGRLSRLPFSIKIMLEGLLRHADDRVVTRQAVIDLLNWKPVEADRQSMFFFPGRVLLQDFTGIPVVNDLAAMRSAMLRLGGDPARVNPMMRADLVIDHSVQVDYFARPDALQLNSELEFERNRERYELLHWAQKAFDNFHVVPPATGIVHQVNIEYLASVVLSQKQGDELVAFPDTLVGTDSHTTMVNGLGVVGWGVGGIEATAAMLGQPIDMLTPDVIGFKLTGKLAEGVTPTDLTLTIVQILRKQGVVEKFVEFFGPGLDSLPVADRTMISNMSPENGATITIFPVDNQTLTYLRMTGRPPELIELVESYSKAQGLFRTTGDPDPEYTHVLELDLSTVRPSLAGPRRPQDRVTLSEAKSAFVQSLTKPKTAGGFDLAEADVHNTAQFESGGTSVPMGQGAVVIAAITSCTNTSNPFVMLGAGLLAKKAVEKGLAVKPYVKTSLAPGSRVVTDYLESAGLMQPLEALGFGVVGYGCTTCIGNSGPIDNEVAEAIVENHLVASAVLSGNRNFEGRIHPYAQANWLASPPLVVAYALAGTVDIDLSSEPLGMGRDGQPVYLQDLWPSQREIMDMINQNVSPEMFRENYARVLTGNEQWNRIESGDDPIYKWSPESTYLQEPPFFYGLVPGQNTVTDIADARVLALLGDSITTDHISPAGSISPKGAAGLYLQEMGVEPKDFNSFGSRRGNDRVMTRGTFGNIRLKNLLIPGVEGSYSMHLPSGEQDLLYNVAMRYKTEGVPQVIIAGKEYGTGSSRDWAAKGPLLLGVRAVIAESFERIHRSNLVFMGVLPLQFMPGENAKTLGLTGHETYTIRDIDRHIEPGSRIDVVARREDGSTVTFTTVVRIDTLLERDYFRNGGILNTILFNLLEKDAAPGASVS